MKSAISRVVISGSLFLVTAGPLLAQGLGRPRRPLPRSPHSVPEIDASAGLLALAAVLAIMAFAWERRRRSV